MRMRDFKNKVSKQVLISAAMILWVTLATVEIDWAQDAPSPLLGGDEKIKITADALTLEHESRYAEFSGNVKVTQGETEIKADTIRINYKENIGQVNKPAQGEEAIEKITAKGNVKIRFENRLAVTDEAVYISKTRVLMLTGDGSKITSGNDSISGARITVYRDNNRIMIEGSQSQRVEAVFYPGEKSE